MNLTRAERELIQLVRTQSTYGLQIMRAEEGGQVLAAITTNPQDSTTPVTLGVGLDFDAAWNSRCVIAGAASAQLGVT